MFLSTIILGAIAVVIAGVVAAAGPDWVAALLAMAAVAAALVAVTTRWEVGQATPDHGQGWERERQRWTNTWRDDGRSAVDEGSTRRAAARRPLCAPTGTGAARPTRLIRSTHARFSASARPVPPALETRDAPTSRGQGPTPTRLAGRLRLTSTGFVGATLIALVALLLRLSSEAAAVMMGAGLIAVAVGSAVVLVEWLTRPERQPAARRLDVDPRCNPEWSVSPVRSRTSPRSQP